MTIRDIKDITFWGMNIPNVIESIISGTKDGNRQNMTELEFEEYELGIENTILLMKQILDQGIDGESITFYNPNIDGEEEFMSNDIVEIVPKLICR